MNQPPRSNDDPLYCQHAEDADALRLLVVPHEGRHVRAYCCEDCAAEQVALAAKWIGYWIEDHQDDDK